MKLLTVTFALAVSIGTAYAVICDVGTGSSTITMNCPTTDKCVWSKVNYLEAKVCYSHMDWTTYSSTRIGCQEFSAFGTYSKICTCKGYRCNKHDPGSDSAAPKRFSSDTNHTATTLRPTAKYPHPTYMTRRPITPTSPHYAYVKTQAPTTYPDRTYTTRRPSSKYPHPAYMTRRPITPTSPHYAYTTRRPSSKYPHPAYTTRRPITKSPDYTYATRRPTTNGVSSHPYEISAAALLNDSSISYARICDVGTGNSIIAKSCPMTDKCVWSKFNELKVKACYTYEDWSRYPDFNQTLGCQEFVAFGVKIKICICEGYRCNRNDPVFDSAPATTVSSDIGHIYTARSGGSSHTYATSISTLLVFAEIVICLL